jgi:hypothetical protein
MSEKCQTATSNPRVCSTKSRPEAARKFNPMIENQTSIDAGFAFPR